MSSYQNVEAAVDAVSEWESWLPPPGCPGRLPVGLALRKQTESNPYQPPAENVSVANRRPWKIRRSRAALPFRVLAALIGFWILRYAFTNFSTNSVAENTILGEFGRYYPFFGGTLLLSTAFWNPGKMASG